MADDSAMYYNYFFVVAGTPVMIQKCSIDVLDRVRTPLEHHWNTTGIPTEIASFLRTPKAQMVDDI